MRYHHLWCDRYRMGTARWVVLNAPSSGIHGVTHISSLYAVPSEIEVVTSLPKTRSGKIMRRVLKAKELGVSPGDISTLEE